MADKDFKVKQGLDLGTPLPISEGGTGQTSASNVLNAILPVQADQSGKILETDGTNVSWVTKPAEYKRGNTASRPGSPTVGDIYVNTETAFIEIYTGVTYGWEQVGGVASAVTSVAATDQGSGRAYNNGQASISFTPGNILGRTYTVTSNPGGFTATGSSSPILITGLQSSTQYTYTVSATNNYGTSATSAASAGVTATTVPQAPTIGVATISGDTATIPFTPGATGGASATYTATSTPGGLTGTSSSSPITISSLTDGETYTFAVTATNSNGTSLASDASNSVTVALDSGSMVPLGEFTLSAAQANVEFTNIPQTYQHLQIRYIVRSTQAATETGINARLNGDSNSNYAWHYVFGDGSSVVAGAGSAQTAINFVNVAGASATASSFAVGVLDVLDYANTSKYKTLRLLQGWDGNGSGRVNFSSGLWRSTSAITSLNFYPSANDFAANTAFQLYGVL